ncbi:hypothetical protein ACROYT_G015382 [Oculina patagonica]
MSRVERDELDDDGIDEKVSDDSGDDDNDVEGDVSLSLFVKKSKGKREKPGRKSTWDAEDIDDFIDIVVSNSYYTRKLIFTNNKCQRNVKSFTKNPSLVVVRDTSGGSAPQNADGQKISKRKPTVNLQVNNYSCLLLGLHTLNHEGTWRKNDDEPGEESEEEDEDEEDESEEEDDDEEDESEGEEREEEKGGRERRTKQRTDESDGKEAATRW